ncbi:MAG: hypothetical protein ACO331_02980 [Prochlorothrix sp.]
MVELASYQKNSPGWQWEKLLHRFGDAWDRFWENLEVPEALNNLPSWSLPEWSLRGLFGLIIGGLVGWLGWNLWKVLWPQWQQWQRQRSGRSPAPVANTAPLNRQQWLDQAQTLRQQGDYRAACRALYFAFLQWLADRPPPTTNPADPSRTDGEYRQLLTQNARKSPRSSPQAPRPTASSPKQAKTQPRPDRHPPVPTTAPTPIDSASTPNGLLLLQTHERLCFSSADFTDADYQACEQAYRQETQLGED